MKKILSLWIAFALCLALMGCGAEAAAVSEQPQTTAAPTASEASESAVTASEPAEEEAEPEADTVITLSDSGCTAQGDGVTVSGVTVTITREGTYRITGTLSDGQLVVDAENAKVTLILDGAKINSDGSAALLVAEADKVIVWLSADSENVLTSTGEYTDPEGKIDAALFAKDDVTIKGTGALTVESQTGHGVVSKDDLKIKSGTITVTAASKGLVGDDSVEISGGDITVSSGADAIHSENDEDAEKGTVLISGGMVRLTSGSDGIDASGSVTMEEGSLSVSAKDDGVHSDGALIVSGGTLTVTDSCEGLEAKTMDISGGTVIVTASDDGLNATSDKSSASGWGMGGDFAAQSGVYIRISGGSVTVNSGGDGLDSNGDLTISGGTVYVSGPTNNGNSALDYNGSGSVTGGTVILAGSSGMAESFGSGSTQGCILYQFSSARSGGTAVTVSDTDGNVLASFTPVKSFQSVVVSAPGMTAGGTYVLTCGDVRETVTLSGVTWSNGGGGMMGGPGGNQGFGGPFDGSQGGFGSQGGQSGYGPEGGFGGGPGGRH